jgi:hypothetical protein
MRIAAMRPAQPSPIMHVPVLPVPQHGCPDALHAPHWFVVAPSMHERPAVHAVTPPSALPMVEQQSWPSPPQAAHMPGMPMSELRPPHASPMLHVPLLPVPQQGCPEAPHVPHWLPIAVRRHDMPVMHAMMPPSLPCVVQHAMPAVPHGPHVPGMSMPRLRFAHPRPNMHVPLLPPPQHDCPDAPHVVHLPPPGATTHERPALHSLSPLQQG